MLIVCQKFRLHKLGHYYRSCHVITHNMREMWGLIYSCAMRTVPMSCHVLLHMQWHHACIMWCTHAGKLATLCVRGMPGITYGCTICTSQMIFIKINCLTFSTLNTKFANQNVLKRIFIAMHNENKADCNETFRICTEEPK